MPFLGHSDHFLKIQRNYNQYITLGVDLMNKLKFNTVDIQDTIVIVALSVGFILAILFHMDELSMSIASGFFGYVGGTASGLMKDREKERASRRDKEDNVPEEEEEESEPENEEYPEPEKAEVFAPPMAGPKQ